MPTISLTTKTPFPLQLHGRFVWRSRFLTRHRPARGILLVLSCVIMMIFGGMNVGRIEFSGKELLVLEEEVDVFIPNSNTGVNQVHNDINGTLSLSSLPTRKLRRFPHYC